MNIFHQEREPDALAQIDYREQCSGKQILVFHIASAFGLMHIGRMVTFLGKIGAVNTRGFVLGDFKSDIELAGAGAECPVVELQGQILEVEPMILKHPVFEFSADVTGSSTAWAKSTSGAKTEPLTRAQLSYKDHCCGSTDRPICRSNRFRSPLKSRRLWTDKSAAARMQTPLEKAPRRKSMKSA